MAFKIVKMAVWRVRAGAGFLSLSWMSSAIYAVKRLTDRFLFATKYNNTFHASSHTACCPITGLFSILSRTVAYYHTWMHC